MMETTALVEIIAQGGATGVFAVFAWWLVKEQRKEREKTTDVWMTYLKDRNGKTEKFMEKHTEALNRIKDSLK